MVTVSMFFMLRMHLDLKFQDAITTLDKLGVLLAVCATPVIALMTHLVSDFNPKTAPFFHTYIQAIRNT
jgi:hypothetical protein